MVLLLYMTWLVGKGPRPSFPANAFYAASRKMEAAPLRLAIAILMERNVTRSLVVPYRDNKDMWPWPKSATA